MGTPAYELGRQLGLKKEAVGGLVGGGLSLAKNFLTSKIAPAAGKALLGSGAPGRAAAGAVRGLSPRAAKAMGTYATGGSQAARLGHGLGSFVRRHPMATAFGVDVGAMTGVLPEWTGYATLPYWARRYPIITAGSYALGSHLKGNTIGQQNKMLGDYEQAMPRVGEEAYQQAIQDMMEQGWGAQQQTPYYSSATPYGGVLSHIRQRGSAWTRSLLDRWRNRLAM